VVRKAEPRDAEAILRLMAGLGRPEVADDPTGQAEVFQAHLDHPDAEVFVAELDGVVAGLLSFWLRPRLNWTTPEGWIPDLFVDPSFRRRGAARALLDAGIDAARQSGCHRALLESGHDRAAAHQLYEAYGFVHYGRSYAIEL
jgi:ribosomal protein S18 acetylase RimI-like enzyme